MESYVCLILNRQRQILTVEALSAETEAEARHLAHQLAVRKAGSESFELWRKGRKLTYSVATADGDGVG